MNCPGCANRFKKRSRIAIAGAGTSGLAGALSLLRADSGVVVFEKSRSLGGRLALRRWEDHVGDHGASCFALPDGRGFNGNRQATGNLHQRLAVIQAPERDLASG